MRMGLGVLKELNNPRTRPAPGALGFLVLNPYVGQQKTWFWVMATKDELVDCWFLGGVNLNAMQSSRLRTNFAQGRRDEIMRRAKFQWCETRTASTPRSPSPSSFPFLFLISPPPCSPPDPSPPPSSLFESLNCYDGPSGRRLLSFILYLLAVPGWLSGKVAHYTSSESVP